MLSIAWLSLSAGAYGPSEAPRGLTEIVLDDPSIGGRRTAFVKVPPGAGPFPVVLAFHGGHGQTGMDMATKWQSAYGKPVILVFPSGNPNNPDDLGWIGPERTTIGPDNKPVGDPAQDLRFVKALIDEVDRKYAA